MAMVNTRNHFTDFEVNIYHFRQTGGGGGIVDFSSHGCSGVNKVNGN